MQSILNNINSFYNQLQSLLPMKREDEQRLEKKVRLELNYNSNHIEGNTLTYGETELLLIFGKTTGNHEAREYKEMEAHDVAFDIIKDWAKDENRILTEADIRNLNQTILVQPFWKEAITPDGQQTRKEIKIGVYKDQPNSVRLANGEIFNYTSPADTPIRMHELIEWFRNQEEKKELHTVELAALFHYRFVCIHPFDDGNGRIARLLMNYILLKNYLPPVIIKSTDKKNYLFALNLADTGNINAFNEYIANQLLWSLEIYIKAAKGENIEDKEDIDKRIDLLNKKSKTKTVATLSKSPELIYNLLKESIIPLFIELEKNLDKLKSMFIDFEKLITYKIFDTVSNTQLDTKESDWEILQKNWLENNIRFEKKSMEFFNYYYALFGFRSNLKLEHLSFHLDFKFTQYYYEIKIHNERFDIYPYNQQLTTNDIQPLVRTIIKYLLDEIEKYA